MATTAGGLPYPVGTDKLRDGDNAIRALAEAADALTLKAVRMNTDEIPASVWMGAAGVIGTMPAGLYWASGKLFWTLNYVGSNYTWGKFSVNGVVVGGSGIPVGGYAHDINTPICHAWYDFVSHPGGAMNLNMEAGFASAPTRVHAGTGVWAVRLGPLP